MFKPAPKKTDFVSRGGGSTLRKTTLNKQAICTSDNGHNKINPERLMRIIRHLGYSCTRSEIQTMLKGIKPDDKDDVEFDDFLSVLDSKVQDGPSDIEISQAFVVFDRSKTGLITSSDLYSVMETLGLKVDKEQLSTMFNEADIDGDGVIDFEDFYRLVKRK